MEQKFKTINGRTPLMESPTAKYLLTQYDVTRFNSECARVKYSLSFQRYYLFNNLKGGDGHPWQRNLFLSVINYEPIGQIEWVKTTEGKIPNGKVINKSESLDGQQRTKSWQAIWEGKVRLPGQRGSGESIILIDGEEVDVSGFNIHDLERDYEDYFNKWVSEYTFIILESTLSRKEKHERFYKVNNHNTLSAQDIRSAMDNVLSHYLNEMVLPKKPMFDFMKVNTQTLDFEYLQCSAKGKLLQEIISKYVVYVHKNNFTNVGGSQIDKLYNQYDSNVKTIGVLDLLKPRIEKTLKTANYVIKHSPKSFWKKRDILLLFIVIDKLNEDNIKFDSTLLADNYQSIIANLKQINGKLNDWAVDKGYLKSLKKSSKSDKLPNSVRERDNTFAACYTAGDGSVPLEFVIESILFKLEESDIVRDVSRKRAFTQDEKRQVALLQDCKCASCRKKLDINKTNTFEGDHIKGFKDGGETTLDNCEILCLSCHQTKTLHPQMYKEMRERFDEVFSQQPQVA